MAYSTEINRATLEQLQNHLVLCDNDFVPPLSQTVDIAAYSRKLFLRSTRFESWEADSLAAVVAAYINGERDGAFISSVSVDPLHRGRGLAKALIARTAHTARAVGCRTLTLEVSSLNSTARSLYGGLGFAESQTRGTTITMELHMGTENRDG